MANYYGNTDGTTNSSFRVVCEYTATDQNNGYYQYKYRFYIQVTKGNFYGTSFTTSWGSNVTVNGTGKYGYSNYYTKNVAYGSGFTLGSAASAQYTASQTYKSSISGSTQIATAPTKTYTIKFNANGGSGAPGNQTKTYGVTLKLSTTKPTRNGYSFLGWSTSSSATSATWTAGGNYTANASDTLYAVWKANTYAVKFDANGGTGAPAQQTKTYGATLKLSSTKPTRANYNFLGWGTSVSSTTVSYAAGANYTANAAITLYAIWELAYVKPRITNLSAERCDNDGTISDEGNNCLLSFSYETDYPIDSIVIWIIDERRGYEGSNDFTGTHEGNTSGVFSQTISYNFDTEYGYALKAVITDSSGSSEETVKLHPITFAWDARKGGKGFAVGMPSNKDCFQVNFLSEFYKMLQLANNIDLAGLLSNGDLVSLMKINQNDQVELNWTAGGLKGRVLKELWSGQMNSGSITIQELPYYNIFALLVNDDISDASGGNRMIICARDMTSGGTALAGSGASVLNGNTRILSVAVNISGTKLYYNGVSSSVNGGISMVIIQPSKTTLYEDRYLLGVYGIL